MPILLRGAKRDLLGRSTILAAIVVILGLVSIHISLYQVDFQLGFLPDPFGAFR
jgi:hypothetical protein